MNKLLIITLGVGFVIACTAMSHAESKAKVLFIGKQPDHPFGTHMYLHTGTMLTKCLKLSNVDAVVSDGWPTGEGVLEGISAIVVYTTPAAELLLDGPHRDQFEAMMKKGIGLVTIHWASSIYEKNLARLGPAWFSYTGGTWVTVVGLHTGKSPLICRGWKGYELLDEYYLNPTIQGATPLLQVMAKGKPVVVGWSYERATGGRAFTTTLGHFYNNFQREPFRRMIVNGILWAAKVEVPMRGAPVKLSESDLALPPKP